jgi:outer membrane protein OmpA-like peptidoglycan-associated protein
MGIEDQPLRRSTMQSASRTLSQNTDKTRLNVTTGTGPVLQRKCAYGNQTIAGGEWGSCVQKKGLLQRKPQHSGLNTQDAEAVPPVVHDVLHSPGQPLDSAMRAFMDSRFGHDFSSVRVHTDTPAADSARSVNAKAYTVGNHIVFSNGLYNPSSQVGRRLIAHELAHTIQQHGVASATPQAQSFRISEPGDSLEREADAVAGRVTAGEKLDGGNFTRAGQSGSGVQSVLLQRENGGKEKKKSEQKKTDEPLIPMPIFEEFDPVVIVPDIPGLPDFVKGQKVALSHLKKALDILRGKKKGASDSKRICDLIPGMEIAELGKFAGQCCVKFKRDEVHCCTWRTLSIKDGRCCKKDEVLLPNNSCFKPQLATPTTTVSQTTKPPSTTPFPRLELQTPRIRFGTIESMTIDGFALNSATIPAGREKELDHLAALLKIYKDAEIHIEGHTDSSNTEEYNKTLSEKRVEAVKNALVKRGVSAAKMAVEGLGETQLRFPAESNEGEKAANRRVDVWFYTPPSKTMAEELQLQVP